MIPKFGPVELTLILVIVVMLFGVGKLPELFGSIGRGVREFRKNSEVGGDDDAKPADDTTTTTPTSGPTAPAA